MNQKIEEYTVDFTNVKTYYEMHRCVRDSLNFPDYYGCNWDAFWDCIRDLIPLDDKIYIKVISLDVIQQKKFGNDAELFVEILKEYKHSYNNKYVNDIIIEFIDRKTGAKTYLG